MRSVLSLCLVVMFVLPALVWSISTAHFSSLERAKMTELELMSYVLIADFDLRESVITMPVAVLDERFNITQSGYHGYIKLNDTLIWQSASVTNIIDPARLPRTGAGETRFSEIEHNGETWYLYSFTAEFLNYNRYEAIHFHIANHARDLQAEHAVFTRTLWQSTLVISLVIAIVLILSLLSVLLPVRTLIAQLKRTRQGQQSQLSGEFPLELNAMKYTINRVLQEEQQQRERYQNALQDLAHSLKTPLTVIKGDPALPNSLHPQVDQIDQIIQRQLSRARLSQKSGHQQIELSPVVKKMCESMCKIHRDKSLSIIYNEATSIKYAIDQADWYEILGNILDNACKASQKLVNVTLNEDLHWIILAVEDDGEGIPIDQQQQILKRGYRLDQYTEGSGIGLATVNDLVDLYGGKIRFSEDLPFTLSILLPK